MSFWSELRRRHLIKIAIGLAFEERDPFADQITHNPKFVPLRADPLYPALAARVAPKYGSPSDDLS